MHYYVALEGGLGDIIKRHHDPGSAIGFAADAKRRGHHITCLVNSYWRQSAKELVALSPAFDRVVLAPPWDFPVGPDLRDRVKAATQIALRRLGPLRKLKDDRRLFAHQPAPFYLARSDLEIVEQIRGRCIAVQPTSTGVSTGPRKDWSAARWQHLLMALPEALPHHSVVLLGAAVAGLSITSHGRLVDLTGRTALREAIALLLRADALIGIDSFLRWAAYHCDVPSVVLYQLPPQQPDDCFAALPQVVGRRQHRVLLAGRLPDIEPSAVCEALGEVLPYADGPRAHVQVVGPASAPEPYPPRGTAIS